MADLTRVLSTETLRLMEELVLSLGEDLSIAEQYGHRGRDASEELWTFLRQVSDMNSDIVDELIVNSWRLPW